MRSDQTAPANGRPTPASDDPGSPVEAAALRRRYRRQASVIDTLTEAVFTLRRGATTLKAENSELRAANDRLRGRRPAPSPADGRFEDGEPAEVAIALSFDAPGAARSVVADYLAGRVATSEVENAKLLVSEMVTNSVRHSGAPHGEDVIVRVHLSRGACRLEVQDPGNEGAIAPQPPDLAAGQGMGLNLVGLLSERWGVVRTSGGPTRVWAQLPSARAAPR
jgi:anti-sigma regulatory factor (Ser/Thr protein kinase)